MREVGPRMEAALITNDRSVSTRVTKSDAERVGLRAMMSATVLASQVQLLFNGIPAA